MLTTGINWAIEQIREGPEMVSTLAKLLESAFKAIQQLGFEEGHHHGVSNIPKEDYFLHDQDCQAVFKADQDIFDNMQVPLAGLVSDWAGQEDGFDRFKEAYEVDLVTEDVEESTENPPPP